MTREEADKNLENITIVEAHTVGYMCEEVDNLFDIVFDDIESRTCKNCKHFAFWLEGADGIFQVCSETGIAEYESDEDMKDFGCNKFERKD